MTATAAPAVDPSSVAADQLKSLIERIERLEEEKAGIAGDIKDVYAEARPCRATGGGGDPRTLHAGARHDGLNDDRMTFPVDAESGTLV